MAGDFNKPSGSSLRVNFMTEIRDMFADLAKMVFTSTSNIPSGCIRLNETTHKFEKYNGSTWGTLDLTGLNVGTVGGFAPSQSPAANQIPALDASKDLILTSARHIKLANYNGRLIGKTTAGGDTSLIYVGGDNNVKVGDGAQNLDLISNDGNVTINDNIAWHAGNQPKMLTGTASWTPGLLLAGNTVSVAITVIGISPGDAVLITPPGTTNAILTGRYLNTDTASATYYNASAGSVTPPAGTYKAVVIK